ncbi:MAG TPA: hypothetical protein VFG69_03930, partial [Nannocystaceae bacterium]|nr:hypothetical protein [Nannocystaceae bacterium]
AAIAGAIATASGCSVAPYVCARDEQCTLAGREGHCEDVGYCSYPDDDCPSGARFSEHAADELADRCVEQGGATTSASSGGPAGCGDGVQDGDEE